MKDEFDFNDLTVIQIPVRYKGQVYLLCEANGEAGMQYRNATFAAVKATKGGENIGIEGLASIEPLLVHLCLYEAEEDQNGRLAEDGQPLIVLALGEKDEPIRASKALVNAMPSRVLQKLYEKAEAISELSISAKSVGKLKEQRDKLDEKIKGMTESEETLGNVPSSTEGGSD